MRANGKRSPGVEARTGAGINKTFWRFIMERRIFLFGGIAGLISTRSRLAVDAPFLKDLRKERRGVGHAIPGGKLQPEFDVTGWQLNIEEDDHTLFDFVIINYGPKSDY
jgi:hypothetical protein